MYSHRRRANARNISFETLYGGQFSLETQIKPKLSCCTQHHSFFRNLPSLFTCIHMAYFVNLPISGFSLGNAFLRGILCLITNKHNPSVFGVLWSNVAHGRPISELILMIKHSHNCSTQKYSSKPVETKVVFQR